MIRKLLLLIIGAFYQLLEMLISLIGFCIKKFKIWYLNTTLVNILLIPSILLVTIIVAGIFAFMPIDKATTVHTTIFTDIAEEVRDQDRYVFWNIDATATITDMILIPDTDVDIDGTITVTLVDEGPSSFSLVNCQTASGGELTINAALNTINDVGTIDSFTLPDDCESIEVDVANGDNIIISLLIDITEEG